MSEISNKDKKNLEKLIKKVLNYRVIRNIDKILNEQNISHYEISIATGRSNNWFNRTFNEVEDMRLSTFIKIISAINKIVIERSTNTESKLLAINDIFDEEIFKFSLVFIDLQYDDLKYLIENDTDTLHGLINLKSYVGILKNLNNVISQEEIDSYNRLIKSVNHKEYENDRT